MQRIVDRCGEMCYTRLAMKNDTESLELAWNMIVRMRELGYHFRLSWNCYAQKMEVNFLEGNCPRHIRRQWTGRDESLFEAVTEAIGKWQVREEVSDE